ncbi:hypothetical protein DTO164E3_8176 [Paecilomyces variotii]|nr:hypothetical protein DTO164E3_8176 [Paecilomyces variotii]KAJ9366187.1 hypothetical protein DTO282E5_9126 [Paecilomyces variotii]
MWDLFCKGGPIVGDGGSRLDTLNKQWTHGDGVNSSTDQGASQGAEPLFVCGLPNEAGPEHLDGARLQVQLAGESRQRERKSGCARVKKCSGLPVDISLRSQD